MEEWDNGKRVEAKKETAQNDESLEDRGRPAAPAAATTDEVAAAAPSKTGHGHDHELDIDLGNLPTLWYGETHQIRTDESLAPNQGML